MINRGMAVFILECRSEVTVQLFFFNVLRCVCIEKDVLRLTQDIKWKQRQM